MTILKLSEEDRKKLLREVGAEKDSGPTNSEDAE